MDRQNPIPVLKKFKDKPTNVVKIERIPIQKIMRQDIAFQSNKVNKTKEIEIPQRRRKKS